MKPLTPDLPPKVREAIQALTTTLLQGVRDFVSDPERTQERFVQNAVELERALEPGKVHRAFIAAYFLTQDEIMDEDSGERLAERMLTLLGLTKISPDKRILLRLDDKETRSQDESGLKD